MLCSGPRQPTNSSATARMRRIRRSIVRRLTAPASLSFTTHRRSLRYTSVSKLPRRCVQADDHDPTARILIDVQGNRRWKPAQDAHHTERTTRTLQGCTPLAEHTTPRSSPKSHILYPHTLAYDSEPPYHTQHSFIVAGTYADAAGFCGRANMSKSAGRRGRS